MERVRDELTLQNFTLKQQLNDLKKHINTVNQVPYYTIHILILFQKCFGKKGFETIVDINTPFFTFHFSILALKLSPQIMYISKESTAL